MKNVMIIILLLILTSISHSQKNYFVAKDGTHDFSTIAQVNAASLNSGDVVSFKGGERFADAILICKKGITYTSYGTGQAIIGDSTSSLTTDATIKIDKENVTLDNLKVYGYKDAVEVIKYSKNGLTIEDCEIAGGQNSHDKWSNGIYQTSIAVSNVTIQRNNIHGFGQAAIAFSRPYNFDIGYNEIYDLWRKGAKSHLGATAVARLIFADSNNPADVWDCAYTVNIHHNNIHHFDYTAIGGVYSRMIIEYNEIHHNLDERIYRGGVAHGSMGKLWDCQGDVALGSLGIIVRYNYVHDLIRKGEVNKSYAPPNSSDYYTGVYTGTITTPNSGKGVDYAVYLYSVGENNYAAYGNHFGDQINDVNGADAWGEISDATISGLGYAGHFIHNNIFYNCDNIIANRGWTKPDVYRADLASYFINNTIINCGQLNRATNQHGVYWTDSKCNSPAIFANNIINLTNTNARIANRFEGKKTYLGYNVYTNQSGFVTSFPESGANKATFAQYRADDLVPENEYYSVNQTTIWEDTSSTIFVAGLGIDGCYIPDVRLKAGGVAYNTGKAFNTLGGNHTMNATYWSQALTLGQDGAGRSFAYDILGNLRKTNDIGAVGVAGTTTNSPQLGLKVLLEGAYINGKMKTDLITSKLVPVSQPYGVNPWNIYDDIVINYPSENYVDWVLVQLRDNLTNTKYSKVAVLTEDGTVLNPDGSSFSFSDMSTGEYYLVIKHRNHLGIMSANKIKIEENVRIDYDFTDSQSKAHGEKAMIDLGNGKFGLIAGDGNTDGIISVLDYSAIANNILSRGYAQGDVDMNGVMNVLDYSFISRNILKICNLP